MTNQHTTSKLLEIKNLNVTFNSNRGLFQAVKALDLDIYNGQTVALVGESGCGKSTTALSIMRLLDRSAKISGQINFAETNLLALSKQAIRKLRGREISMIFQEPMTSLNPVYSIGQQIMEALIIHEKLSRQAAKKRAIELLDLVNIDRPDQRINDYPHNLSGGQRQRVMIAMAVACQPRLLIADEPTTALDVSIQAQVLELLDRLRREMSMAILLITHDLGVVSQWADHVAVMYNGIKVEENTTTAIFQQPQHSYTRGLLGASLHGGNTTHYTESRLPEIRVDQHDQSANGNFELYKPALKKHSSIKSTPATLLAVNNLYTAYQQQREQFYAVNNVSFTIEAGQSVGLVGESGSGKSSLCKTLMRLIPAAQGDIIFAGHNISKLAEKDLKPWRRRIQMVFQDPYASLNPRQTVFNILDTVLKVHGIRSAYERNTRIKNILDHVGLPANSGERYPHEFSGGQRQRIGIARALILKPELLVCDEPVSALDVSVQAQILNLLVDLKQEFNLSYLFISHDLAVVKYISDKVLVMHQGKIVEQGSHNQIWDQPQHAYTKSLLQAIPGELARA